MRWGTRTIAPINLIVASKVITLVVVVIIVVVVVVSPQVAAEDGVGGALTPGVALTLPCTACSLS